MVQKTVTRYECDVCGTEGERYTVGFPDGVLSLDRCEKHARKVEVLRKEKGTWVANGSTKSVFKVSSLDEIVAAKKKAK